MEQGEYDAAYLVVNAAHCAVRSPGPLRAFFLRPRKGKGMTPLAQLNQRLSPPPSAPKLNMLSPMALR